MMNNVLEYKGYYTKIEYSVSDKVLYGKIEGIKDLVNFESDTAADIETEFHVAVDEYLEFCKEVGKNPDKTYRGVFNVRIAPELHKKISIIAMKNGESLNQTVENAIRDYVYSETSNEGKMQETICTLSIALAQQSMKQSVGSHDSTNWGDSKLKVIYN